MAIFNENGSVIMESAILEYSQSHEELSNILESTYIDILAESRTIDFLLELKTEDKFEKIKKGIQWMCEKAIEAFYHVLDFIQRAGSRIKMIANKSMIFDNFKRLKEEFAKKGTDAVPQALQTAIISWSKYKFEISPETYFDKFIKGIEKFKSLWDKDHGYTARVYAEQLESILGGKFEIEGSYIASQNTRVNIKNLFTKNLDSGKLSFNFNLNDLPINAIYDTAMAPNKITPKVNAAINTLKKISKTFANTDVDDLGNDVKGAKSVLPILQFYGIEISNFTCGMISAATSVCINLANIRQRYSNDFSTK